MLRMLHLTGTPATRAAP